MQKVISTKYTERNKIVERTREGVAIAKLKGKYKGRKEGSKDSVDKFLSKPITFKVIFILAGETN